MFVLIPLTPRRRRKLVCKVVSLLGSRFPQSIWRKEHSKRIFPVECKGLVDRNLLATHLGSRQEQMMIGFARIASTLQFYQSPFTQVSYHVKALSPDVP
mmetsp:Transcript_8759/g.29236  ORF Transcript_8759/g.29236 Transcript_8759/m.29236 type:complete len:99 (+) Transcript_8759:1382-1678(+)